MKRKMLFCQNYGTNLATNLVAYYAFEGNANDSINAHNGTLVGSPTFPSGKHNLGINFGNDGVNRYVDIPDNDDFSFTNGTNDVPFSISMWVNFTAFSSTGNWLIDKRITFSNGVQEWQVIRYENQIQMYCFNATTSGYIGIGFPFSILSTWVQVVATYNGVGNTSITGLKLYLNGVNQSVVNKSSGTYTKMPNGNSFVRLGMAGWTIANVIQHKGLLDELAIWKNRELTSAEVLELYNSGSGKFNPF